VISLRFGDMMESVPSDPGAILVLTTNGFVRRDGACVMGRGIARQAALRWPDLPFKLGRLIREYGNRPFRLTPTIWTLPVKHVWYEPASMELIEASLEMMGLMVAKFQPPSIHMPRPGCGNGQLSWRDVEPLVIAATADWPVPVYVWHFRPDGGAR
jgi:hypothetical protein